MRIRVIQMPSSASCEGIDLKRFRSGETYEVGASTAALLFAEGWAVPLDPLAEPEEEVNTLPLPPNLLREIFPPYYDAPPPFALDRRKRPRKR